MNRIDSPSGSHSNRAQNSASSSDAQRFSAQKNQNSSNAIGTNPTGLAGSRGDASSSAQSSARTSEPSWRGDSPSAGGQEPTGNPNPPPKELWDRGPNISVNPTPNEPWTRDPNISVNPTPNEPWITEPPIVNPSPNEPWIPEPPIIVNPGPNELWGWGEQPDTPNKPPPWDPNGPTVNPAPNEPWGWGAEPEEAPGTPYPPQEPEAWNPDKWDEGEMDSWGPISEPIPWEHPDADAWNPPTGKPVDPQYPNVIDLWTPPGEAESWPDEDTLPQPAPESWKPEPPPWWNPAEQRPRDNNVDYVPYSAAQPAAADDASTLTSSAQRNKPSFF